MKSGICRNVKILSLIAKNKLALLFWLFLHAVYVICGTLNQNLKVCINWCTDCG